MTWRTVTKPSRDAFEIRLTPEQHQQLAIFLCDELQAGLDARAVQEQECDYWHSLYEQARTRTGRNAPWPDAADLTSYLACEKVDALHARIMRTIWTEPIWNVEGWGANADKAPFVEEFHQWKAEEERLQSVVDRLVLQSLIEPRGLLEVSEGTEWRTTRKTVRAKIATDPMMGGPIFGEDGQPELARDEQDQLQETSDEHELAAETVIDSRAKVRTGPVYRLLPYRDSVILPGHARDKDDIWAYGKRFWRRLSDLKLKADAKVYDHEAIDKLGAVSDQEGHPALQRAHQGVAPADRGQAEIELWEVLVLLDLEDLFSWTDTQRPKKDLRGPRWYLTTIHLRTQQLLRIQHDDLERARCVPVILFPRVDRATEGFSFIGHKLITTIEEHTAWRNMAADRASLVVQAPIKRLTGALWDPYDQPWGPKQVIDVRDMREIEAMTVPDFTAPVLNHIQMQERTAERLAGINDIASGQVSSQDRTLGEVQMATEQSFVRMDLIVRRFQEALEDLAQIRHAIWQRTLADRPDGEEAPQALMQNLEGRGVSIDQYLPEKRITAQLLAGAYRFKPHGSVETADPNRLRNDFVQAMQALPALLQAFPMLVSMFQTPQAARAMGRQFLRVFRMPNQQAFLGSAAEDFQKMQMVQMMPMLQQLLGAGGPPAAPNGAPPMPGAAPAPAMPQPGPMGPQ